MDEELKHDSEEDIRRWCKDWKGRRGSTGTRLVVANYEYLLSEIDRLKENHEL